MKHHITDREMNNQSKILPVYDVVLRQLEDEWLQKGKFKCELPKMLEARRANRENVEFPVRLDQQGHRVKPAKRVSMDSEAREAELAPAGW
jgi:hypothetical protein